MSEFNIKEKLILHQDKYKDIYKYYEELKNIWWFPNEINFKKDNESYNKLSAHVQNQLKYVLSFFAFGDLLVLSNLDLNFQDMIKTVEVNLFYGLQSGNEAIHNEVYNNAINEICYTPDIVEIIKNDITLKNIYNYINDNINNENKDDKKLLVVFIMLEGLLFSGSFAFIYWLDKKYPNSFPGLKLSNDFISRDENIHTMFGITLLSYAKQRLNEDAVYEMFTKFINNIICQFCHNIINASNNIQKNDETETETDNIMTYNNLLNYYKFQADYLLELMGYNKLYNIYNPFNFMNQLALERRANNFQSQNYNYIMDPKINLELLPGFIKRFKFY
jgi:ribonucleoside-diphosphate reductase subunit M2